MDSITILNKCCCVLIGNDSLLLECAERLLDADWCIRTVFSDASKVQNWAKSRGIEARSATQLSASDVADIHCDYVFSITWLKEVPRELRNLPRIAAINIQDSPLPRYSGPNGPAWALMAREQNFGVCWHIAEQRVGEGGILKRTPVVVEQGETTLSLNMKCFEAALDGFEELLVDLKEGRLEILPQEEPLRECFSRDQRPSHWGCLDWTQSAVQLQATVRALDYGGYNNPFCMAKLLLGGQAFGVIGAIAEPAGEEVAAGTVLMAAADSGLLVATADGNLRVTELQTLAGVTVNIADLMKTEILQVGQVLPALPIEQLKKMQALLPDLTENEAHWVEQLGAGDSVHLPFVKDPDGNNRGERKKCPVTVPPAFFERFRLEDRNANVRAACLALLSRHVRQPSFRVRYLDADLVRRIEAHQVLLCASIPLVLELDDQVSFEQTVHAIDQQIADCVDHAPFLHDLQGRFSDPQTQRPLVLPEIAIALGAHDPQAEDSLLTFRFDGSEALWLEFDSSRISLQDAGTMALQLATLLESISTDGTTTLATLDFLPADVRQKMLLEWNNTAVELPGGRLVHELISAKAAEMGESVAVVAEGKELTYAQLEEQSAHLAHYLVSLGAGPGSVLGICMQRTTDMMVALLAILKSGAGYLPLDPDFPPSRLRYMIEDSGVGVVLSDCWSSHLVSDSAATVVFADQSVPSFESAVLRSASPKDLAYVIYTSGSTGNPKGVMLEHEQVTNFFLGMNERLGTSPGVWLAVTSLSFDISVLELLWTLTCGYKVVLFEGFDRGLRAAHSPAPHDSGQIEFSLMLWSAAGGGPGGRNPYELMLEAARFGDRHGYRAIWMPERHFHEFGGPYPNPAVAGAAIAAITENIAIRTGSVVLPLHDPLLIAEDWAMVDNLSGGRVGLGIASGWHPNDFVLQPESYDNRKEIMKTRMGTLRSLWRGESVAMPNPVGETPEIVSLPRPVQSELPLWLTAAGNPETFRLAGELGVHVLTHLLGQTTEELSAKLSLYREAWKEAGHPGSGHVTMMLHTMLGADREEMREMARGPMCSYLATAADLLKDHMSAWAAVRTPMQKGNLNADFSLSDLSAEDVGDLLDFAYERYFETDALFGTPDSGMQMIERMRDLEVDELACLIDFGAEPELILRQLPFLEELRLRVQGDSPTIETHASVEELIRNYQVTHLQCTPSMATMLLAEPAIAEALGTLQVMMVGGEALTEDLAHKLREVASGRVMNMYGLTETAIWSSTADIQASTELVSLGEPLANNRFYVLDKNLQLVPPGLPGELFIAGLCVARGYHGRADLTAEAFLPDPFDPSGNGVLYRSGDQVRQLPDGTMRFLGRGDQQVKVNGYRIELGDVEAALLAHKEVSQAVALVATNKFHTRVLVAHFVLESDSAVETEDLRAFLRTRLPEYMVPREFHSHESFPKTNNGKTDRKALAHGPLAAAPRSTPSGHEATSSVVATTMSAAELEATIESIWLDILGLDSLDRNANFFDLGGHSLLTISCKRILKMQFGIDVALIALFRHSTVRTLATFLFEQQDQATAAASSSSSQAQSAAAKRAALRKARRRRPEGEG